MRTVVYCVAIDMPEPGTQDSKTISEDLRKCLMHSQEWPTGTDIKVIPIGDRNQ